jgi:hypothetical protein
MIKSFRGLLKDGGQDRISLHTNNGRTGYRITKLQIIIETPLQAAAKSVVKVYSDSQSTVDSVVNFSDQTLLGVATYHDQPVAEDMSESSVIIFDNQVFNQDIFITHHEQTASQACNYYIELEEMSLALDEATVATLQDIRNSGDPT